MIIERPPKQINKQNKQLLLPDYEWWYYECENLSMSTVLALKIHMSKNAYDALKAFPEFITECRDPMFDEVVHDCNLKSHFLCSNA